jgi:translation initiation factor IF-2
MKLRVHQLAKELGYESPKFLEKLTEIGVQVKSHLSGLTDDEIADIKRKLNKKDDKPKEHNKSNENHNKYVKETPNINKHDVAKEQNRVETNKKENEDKVELNVGLNNNSQKNNNNNNNKNYQNRDERKTETVNRDSNRDNNRDNRNKYQNKDNRDRNRNYQNRDNNQRDGRPSFDRDNQNRDGKDNNRNFHNNRNRDNRNYQNRDNNQRDGRPSFDRDNQNRDRRDGKFDRNSGRNFDDSQNRDRNYQNRDNNQRDGRPSFDRDNRNRDNRNYQNRDNRDNRDGQRDRRSFERGKDDTRDSRNFGNRNNKKEVPKNDIAPSPIAEKPKNNVKGKAKFDKKRYEKEKKQKEEEKKLRELRSDFRKDDKKKKNKKKQEKVMKDEIIRIEGESIGMITIGEEIVIKDLAEKLGVNVSDIIKKFFMQGKMLTANAILSFEEAEEVALDYEVIVEKEEVVEVSYGEKYHLEVEDKEQDLVERAPVITIMGHVDHGKTSLLDALRHTNIIEGEAGGITQRIGAYQVNWKGQKVTFIDTPGHEAFTEMRARGANITDISILIVAADDGVKPQTVEAISHAKEAGVPIIVAINKIDKPGADPMKVRTELTEYGLMSPDWGGNTEFVEISAKQKINLEELLETILITAELLELKANPKKRAKAVVVESRLDPKMGAVADILIQEGELKIGDIFVAGEAHGRVRSMLDDRGNKIEKATLSQPVEITGFSNVPNAGDVLYGVNNDKQAKKIVEDFIKEKKINDQNKKKHISLESLSQELEEQQLKELKCIIRADSKGSVEALKESLLKLNNEKAMINIIQGSAGAVTEGDVKLAEASNAIIIAFNVRPTTPARIEAEKTGVEIRNYNVIYHVTEEIEKALKGMLDPEYKEVYFGRIEVKQVFKISNVGNIAGAIVVDGKVSKTSKIRVIRDGIIIYDGELDSLKRFKDDAKEVVMGQECGIGIKDFNDIKEGDIIESYILEEIPR